MTWIASFVTACLFSVFLIACDREKADAGEQLRISGTGGMLAVMQEVASEFERMHPGIDIQILPSMGSSGGIKAVLAGALDIGLSSRNLKEYEQAVTARVYARSPFIFAVTKNNPASGLTVAELEDIYERRTEKWPDGNPIRIILRPAVEFDTTLLKSISPRMDRAVTAALARQGMIVAITDQENADAIEKVSYALGTMTLGQMIAERRNFKPLLINGIRPDLATLSQGKYPYSKTYYLVTNPRPKKSVKKFVDFACSAEAGKTLSRSGYQHLCR